MEQILVDAWITCLGLLVGVIGMTFIWYYFGHEKGYEKGRRDERIKQYKQMQQKKVNFIDAD